MASPEGPVGLNNCDREPIHIPGSIQPHGVMLVCDPKTLIITHASANAAAFMGRTGNINGLRLGSVIGEQAAHELINTATRAGGAEIAGVRMDMALSGLAHLVDACTHKHLGRLFFEFQQVGQGGESARDAFDLTHSLVLRIGRETSIDAIAASGAKLVKAMLGYDRVMVYRLLHNGAGHVIAEARKPGLSSFMGQHFPASDIPYQARRLYLLNTIRAIGDADYAPVPILPLLNDDESPIDMSFAQLRSVSPIHCEYLRNMGVAASLSISIIVDGELWGLVSCHHNSPKIVPMPLRIGAELFGRYFSLQIALAERRAQTLAAAQAREHLDQIVASFNPEENVGDILRDRLPRLAQMMPCTGAGLWLDGRWCSTGDTPSEDQIGEVIALVNRAANGEVWETHDLRAHLGNASTYGTLVAGMLAIPISSAPRDYFLLFRSEEAHNIEWAGAPVKEIVLTPQGERLSPRGSFDVWREEVRGRSQPWSLPQRAIAETIRSYLRDVLLRFSEVSADERGRAEERRRVLNDELNHRVKNIIALVKSIAIQTGTHALNVKDYTESLEGRLRALAFAHDQSLGGRAGDLTALIEAEAGLHRYGSTSDRVAVHGPPLGLDDRAFGVLALVIHEMMTNAAKYGSLSVPQGRLALSWRLTDSGDCAIEWRESDGPAVSPPDRQGFGSKLVQSTIAYDLGGSVSIEYRPTGLWACFVIPAKRLCQASTPIIISPPPPLEGQYFIGKTVLLIEDQSLIAMDTEETLRELGAVEVQCCANVVDALAVLDVLAPDCAICDFNLGDHTSAVIADRLLALEVPFVFATGYGDSVMIPERFGRILILHKPINARMILEAFSSIGSPAVVS